MTRWVCITGMHRSGTSLLTRVINLLGVSLGPQERHLPANEDNPKGFWENAPLVLLSDELLRMLGGSWADPPALADGWWQSATLDEPRQLAHRLLTGQLGDTEVAAWKDPRSSLLLPFWASVIDIHAVVVALRDPAEVAQSLHRRDQLDPEASADLWLRYTCDALRHSTEHVVVPYLDLLADPRAEAKRLAQALSLPTPSEQTLTEIDAFADRDLRRATEPIAAPGPRMRVAQAVYEALRGLPHDQASALAQELGRPRPSVTAVPALAALAQARQALDQAVRALGGAALSADEASPGPDASGESTQLPGPLGSAPPHMSCREVLLECALFASATPPSDARPELGATLIEAARRLNEAGAVAVFHWDNDSADPAWAQRLEAAGGLLLAPVEGRPSRWPSLPTISQALQPRVLAQVGATSTRAMELLLAMPSDATTLLVADEEHHFERVAGRFAAVCSPGRLVDDVLARMVLRPPARVPRLGRPTADHTPGRVSIVIPAWNGVELTRACLTAVAETTDGHDTEVIVIDNGSVDETAAEATRLGARVITNETNLGFATACNQGMEASTGEYVVILNNDTIPAPGWLAALLRPLQQDERIGLCGARSNSVSGHQAIAGAPPLDDVDAALLWAQQWRESTGPRHWLTERIVAFCVAARREALAQVGGFDASLGIGNYEDDELCVRMREADYLLAVADDAVVLHHGSATFAQSGLDYLGLMAEGAAQLGALRRPPPALATGLVLSRGHAESAAQTAASLATICDRVLILEADALRPTELALPAQLIPMEAIACDWSDERAASDLLASLGSRHAVVLSAGEILTLQVDWGGLRAQLGELDTPTGLADPSGPEIRIVQPDTLLATLGTAADHVLEGCVIEAAS